LIDIIEYRYHILCDFENRNLAKHSIGQHNAPMALRTNICHQCLLEIITEGLKLLTEEERAEILKDYILEPKTLTDEEKAEIAKVFLAKTQQEEQQPETGQASEGQESIAESLQEPTGEENGEPNQTILEARNEAQNLDTGEEPYNPAGKPRDELIAKAKELGVEGKIATFTNKMLENEILKKLGGK